LDELQLLLSVQRSWTDPSQFDNRDGRMCGIRVNDYLLWDSTMSHSIEHSTQCDLILDSETRQNCLQIYQNYPELLSLWLPAVLPVLGPYNAEDMCYLRQSLWTMTLLTNHRRGGDRVLVKENKILQFLWQWSRTPNNRLECLKAITEPQPARIRDFQTEQLNNRELWTAPQNLADPTQDLAGVAGAGTQNQSQASANTNGSPMSSCPVSTALLLQWISDLKDWVESDLDDQDLGSLARGIDLESRKYLHSLSQKINPNAELTTLPREHLLRVVDMTVQMATLNLSWPRWLEPQDTASNKELLGQLGTLLFKATESSDQRHHRLATLLDRVEELSSNYRSREQQPSRDEN
jgi:hypothetical protein